MLAAMGGALGAGARAARRVLLPEARRSTAWVADGVLALAMLVVVAQALGTFGMFRRVELAIAVVAVGTLVWVALRGRASPHAEAQQGPPGGTRPRWPLYAGLAGAAVVTGQWGAWTAAPLRNGITDYDSLNYHLTFAARFVQSGSTTGLHFVSPDVPIHLYPANSELLHAVGMLLLGSDVSSIFANVGWLMFAILCGWAAGRRRGLGPATGLAVACVMAAPVMAYTQAGTAVNDAAALAPFLAGLALLVDLHPSPGWAFVSGLAAGLAIGTKATLIAPCAALAVAVVCRSPGGTRRRAMLIWAGAAALTGGYWYVRNWVSAGSPMPSVDLGIGPLALPHSRFLLVNDLGYSVAHYWDRPHIWRAAFVPGLASLGVAWPAVLVAVAAATLYALLRCRGLVRLVALITAVAGIAYALTPTTAVGPNGEPLLFAQNLRYLSPALAAGLILVVLLIAGRVRSPRPATVVPMALLLGVTLLPGSHPPWPWLDPAASIGLGLAAGVVVLLAAWVARLRGPLRAPAVLAGAGLAIVGGALLYHLSGEHRYASDPLYSWVRRNIHGARIAIAGFNQQYPLYGRRWSNYVQYVGTVQPHGGFTMARGCAAWRAGLLAGHFQYVVAMDQLRLIEYPHGVPELSWTESVPGARVVFAHDGATVVRLTRAPDPGACGQTSAGALARLDASSSSQGRS
jgi:hypothetical protein